MARRTSPDRSIKMGVDRAVSDAITLGVPWSPTGARAAALRRVARALEAARDRILRTCAAETGLTREELAPEHTRMTGTLRRFAEVIARGDWVRATVDPPPRTAAERAVCIGPPHDVRSMLVPLPGAVAVFGASNFPLAYGVCGGDTASALAAGCPVVVKEHPAHPRTGRQLHAIARAALGRRYAKVLGYVHHEDPADLRVASALVGAEGIEAVGFTGSVQGGLAVEALAGQRRIPSFCEMGSANVVLVGPSALRGEERSRVARELASSILARVGQQCTRPGIILVHPGPPGDAFVRELGALLDVGPARRMLSPSVAKRYEERCEALRAAGARLLTRRAAPLERSGSSQGHAVPMLWELPPGRDVEDVWSLPELPADLLEEVFGPAALLVRASTGVRYNEAFTINSLAACGYGMMPDPTGRGRVVHHGVSTGVRVCDAMVHGGPFPATNAPHSTAVGPRAIERWCRPVCWQNCPDHALPAELRRSNPRGLVRIVRGVATRARG